MRRVVASLLLFGIGIVPITARAAQYLTEGWDAARTGWIRDEHVFTRENVKTTKLLWKTKLDSPRRARHNLFPPLIIENLPTTSGPKEMAIVAGVSDDLFGIDVRN